MTKEAPKVSIVLPTYNGSRWLGESIESCLSQTFQNFELIIVDDSSTDDSPAIIEKYVLRDSRVQALRQDVNKYLPSALNTGFVAAKGEYFTWTSDDNKFKPDAILKMVQYLDNNQDIDIVYCDYEKFDEDETMLEYKITGPFDSLPIIDLIGACFLYRRKVDSIVGGYDEKLFCVEDYAFWLSAFNCGLRFAHINESLYLYRVNSHSLTSTRKPTVTERTLRLIMDNIAKYDSAMSDITKLRALLRCSRLSMDIEDKATAKYCFQQALNIRPNAAGWTYPDVVEYAMGMRPEPVNVIFGAGKIGCEAAIWCRENNIRISAFTDNNREIWYTEIEKLPVLPPEALKRLHISQVLISSAYQAMSKQLDELGIEPYTTYFLFRGNLEKMRRCNKALEQEATLPQRSINWLLEHSPQGGLKIHQFSNLAYPEVTGYTIPTLLRLGFVDKALEMADYLLIVQQTDGGFAAPEGGPSLYFDTGQALRGLNAVNAYGEKYQASADKAANFLLSALDSGNGIYPQQYAGDAIIPEAIQLYTLPPLMEYSSKRGKDERIEKEVAICAQLYISDDNSLQLSTLTHFLAYQIEALIDLGYGANQKVKAALSKLQLKQTPDGAIPAYNGVDWICTTGLAQIAICLYKVGNYIPADKAMEWLDRHQKDSGGFNGSVGSGAWYFPDRDISWATKYYLDAYQLRVKAHFEQNVEIFPETIAPDDGRVLAIAAEISKGDNILEVGSGKGRIIRRLMEQFTDCSLSAIDISPTMLSCVPPSVNVTEGNSEHMPYSDNLFDIVFAVESVEHSMNIRAAVSEMSRVCKPGGKVIIIDKQASEWGRMQCPPWEQWPERGILESMLKKYCDNVTSEPVRFENADKSETLMVKWCGKVK